MNILSLFKKPPAISAEEVRNIVENRKPDDYLLIDVRQPLEYEQGHIPGARLMPLSELQGRRGELDPEKEMVVYCRTGSRSTTAAKLLAAYGFKKVLNMTGGIVVYSGKMIAGQKKKAK